MKEGAAMLRIIYISMVFLFVTSCVTSSGVLPFGPDTYTVTVESSERGMSAAAKQAITEANTFCQSQGKYFLPKNKSQQSAMSGFGDTVDTYSLIFMCVAENDPEYKRGDWKKNPDAIIEDRRR